MSKTMILPFNDSMCLAEAIRDESQGVFTKVYNTNGAEIVALRVEDRILSDDSRVQEITLIDEDEMDLEGL